VGRVPLGRWPCMCGPGSVREMAIYIVGRVPLGRWPCTLLWLVVWLQEWLHITSTVVALDSGPAPLCLHSGDAMCCCGTWCPGGKELLGRGGSTPEAECQWWVDWLDNERGSAERLQERTWLCFFLSKYPGIFPIWGHGPVVGFFYPRGRTARADEEASCPVLPGIFATCGTRWWSKGPTGAGRFWWSIEWAELASVCVAIRTATAVPGCRRCAGRLPVATLYGKLRGWRPEADHWWRCRTRRTCMPDGLQLLIMWHHQREAVNGSLAVLESSWMADWLSCNCRLEPGAAGRQSRISGLLCPGSNSVLLCRGSSSRAPAPGWQGGGSATAGYPTYP